MNTTLIAIGATMALLAVAAGAFGAHALSAALQGKTADWYQTAAHYHLLHAVGIILCGVLTAQLGNGASIAGYLLLVGILIFSGTLYAMALGAPRWFGAITPIGGLAFIIGWGSLALAALRHSGSQ